AAPYRVGAAQIGGPLLGIGVHVAQDGERDQLVVFGQRNAAHAHRGASGKHPHVADGETNALAAGRGQQHVVTLGADLHVDNRLVVIELHRDDTGTAHIDEVRQLVAT